MILERSFYPSVPRVMVRLHMYSSMRGNSRSPRLSTGEPSRGSEVGAVGTRATCTRPAMKYIDIDIDIDNAHREKIDA